MEFGDAVPYLILGYLVGCGLNVLVARAKGFDVPKVLLASVVLSPVLAYLYIAAVPPVPVSATARSTEPSYMQR